MNMPEDVRNLCRLADISFKSLLLQVVRQPTVGKMTALVERIAREGATRQKLREVTSKPKAGRPKSYVFAYKAPSKQFRLQLSFRKARVEREEIIATLEAILAELRNA